MRVLQFVHVSTAERKDKVRSGHDTVCFYSNSPMFADSTLTQSSTETELSLHLISSLFMSIYSSTQKNCWCIKLKLRLLLANQSVYDTCVKPISCAALHHAFAVNSYIYLSVCTSAVCLVLERQTSGYFLINRP